jgi:4-amino-4-deoxy-L-arabinose transferase-like glycosyltransferase
MSNRLQTTLAVIIIIFVSAFFIFWEIGSYPLSLSLFEGMCGLSAYEVIDGNQGTIRRIWEKPLRQQLGGTAGSGGMANTPFLVYPIAWLFQRFGCGNSYLTLRLPSMIYGILCVPMVYLIAATLFSRRIGLTAAALLGTSVWHMGYSRLCADFSVTLFFCLFSLYLFIRLRSFNPLGFLILGATISYATYFFVTARVVVPIIIITMIFRMFSAKSYFRNYYQHWLFLLLLVGGFFIGLRLQGGSLNTFFRLNVPLNWSVFGGGGKGWSDLSRNLSLFWQRFAIDWGFPKMSSQLEQIIERTADIDPISRYLFPLGLIWILPRFFNWKHFFLLIWVISGIGATVMTAGEFRRMFLSSAPVFIICAIGLNNTVTLLTRWTGKYRNILPGILIIFFLAFSAYLNFSNYFNEYEKLPTHNYFVRRHEWRQNLIQLAESGIVITDLFSREAGWPESMKFEERRLGYENRFVLIPNPAQARITYEQANPPVALYLSNGELLIKQ